MTADPKPKRRIRDKTVKPTGDRCVATGTTYDLHKHHLISRAQGGDDVPENLVWVCARVHDDYHSGSASQRYDAGHLIRKGLGVEHVDYILGHKRGGESWLELRYPSEPW